jgi:hypothetical protein
MTIEICDSFNVGVRFEAPNSGDGIFSSIEISHQSIVIQTSRGRITSSSLIVSIGYGFSASGMLSVFRASNHGTMIVKATSLD